MNTLVKDLKQKATEIGWKYAILCTLIIGLQIVVSLILNQATPDLVEQYPAELTFLLVIPSVDVVGFPLLYLLTLKMPKTCPKQHKMSIGQLICCIMIGAAICGIGALIGNPIHQALTLPFGVDAESMNQLATLMIECNPWIRIIAVGILAPIFVELIFRKFLIDRVIKHGELASILMSGLMFGLFHGNFQQFFFATGLGLFFAFIYVRTGKIWYTMLFHMIINMSTSVISVSLLGPFLKASENLTNLEGLAEEEMVAVVMQELPGTVPYMLWMLCLGICALVGVILLICKRKEFKLHSMEGISNKEMASAALKNWGMLLFYLCGLCLFLYNYLPNIISYFVSK